MVENLMIVGNESSIIYYNLNKQYSNIKKIIITKEIILNSFESPDLHHLFERLKSIEVNNYFDLVKQSKEDGVLDIKLKNDLYSQIHNLLPKLSDTLMDVQLDNFNFMNSVSNSNLTITLRTSSFSISKYYQEKGSILSAIRYLIEDYLLNYINKYRTNKIDDFQIEIYESEEIYKKVLLKKESNILQLYSSFGFSYNLPFDHEIGGEIYYSIGDDFSFYKNKQTHAIVRDHTKIVESEIEHRKRILSNEELVLINNTTKNIDDALIELYINSKGGIKILNISLLENQLYQKSDSGFILNKSSKNYNTISTITLRDDLSEELLNPKYLLIRNVNEVKELLSDLSIIEKVDGVIFTINFYSPAFDKLFLKYDKDLLFFNKNIPKTLECSIDWQNIDIVLKDSDLNKNINTSSDAFSNIIGLNNKRNQEEINKLDNIDLSTPNPAKRGGLSNNSNNVSNIAQSLVSSENSSINNSQSSQNQSSSQNNKKKSAIDFLVDSAMVGPKNTESNQKVIQEEREFIEENSINETSNIHNNNNIDNNNSIDRNIYQNDDKLENIGKNNNYFDDFSKYEQNQENEEKQIQENSINNNANNNFNNQTVDYNSNDFFSDNLSSEKTNILDSNNNETDIQINSIKEDIYINEETRNIKIDINNYENILATNILTSPNINLSKSFFVDVNSYVSISSSNAKIFYLTNQTSDFTNPNLNYILPIDLYHNELEVDYLLINSVEDYFLLDNDLIKEKKIFVNLSKIDKKIRKNFFKSIIKNIKNISLIIIKDDLDYIQDNIERIENIMIRDLESDEDYNLQINKILSFEKKYLMKNNF